MGNKSRNKNKHYEPFVGQVESPCGAETLFLEGSEYEAFYKDPVGYFVAMHGVTKEDYNTWISMGGHPRCGALTSKGSRCRNLLSGGGQLQIKEWVEADGGLCAVHGGLTRKEEDARRRMIRRTRASKM